MATCKQCERPLFRGNTSGFDSVECFNEYHGIYEGTEQEQSDRSDA